MLCWDEIKPSNKMTVSEQSVRFLMKRNLNNFVDALVI